MSRADRDTGYTSINAKRHCIINEQWHCNKDAITLYIKKSPISIQSKAVTCGEI